MNSSSFSQPLVGAARSSGVVRLVRRICVLREQGDTAAAEALEINDLANAVRDFRLAAGVEALSEADLHAMFLVEEKRVADATVLAELLIPQLARVTPAASVVGPRLSAPAAERAEPAPSFRAPEPVAGSTAIPDLLDAMLAADNATRRRSAADAVPDHFLSTHNSKKL